MFNIDLDGHYWEFLDDTLYIEVRAKYQLDDFCLRPLINNVPMAGVINLVSPKTGVIKKFEYFGHHADIRAGAPIEIFYESEDKSFNITIIINQLVYSHYWGRPITKIEKVNV